MKHCANLKTGSWPTSPYHFHLTRVILKLSPCYSLVMHFYSSTGVDRQDLMGLHTSVHVFTSAPNTLVCFFFPRICQVYLRGRPCTATLPLAPPASGFSRLTCCHLLISWMTLSAELFWPLYLHTAIISPNIISFSYLRWCLCVYVCFLLISYLFEGPGLVWLVHCYIPQNLQIYRK